ncbi:hypothetical protein [Dolichospermum sp. UHCC 0259]|nr:hypothetical protein [Dolichospermum sp. UHCC 0259]
MMSQISTSPKAIALPRIPKSDRTSPHPKQRSHLKKLGICQF